jgi:hypothetical protein
VGSGVPCFELEIEEVDGWGPRPGDPGGLALPFAIFYCSDLGILFMVPNSSGSFGSVPRFQLIVSTVRQVLFIN